MLGYIDSFAGLIPCKVLSIEESPNRVRYVKVKVTGNSHKAYGYNRGKVVELTSRAIVPRDKVINKRAMAGMKILPYDWADYMPIQLSLDTNR